MKRSYIKKGLAVLSATIILLDTGYPVQADQVRRYGIKYDNEKYEVKWKTGIRIKVTNSKGYLLGTESNVLGDLRYNKYIDKKYIHTLVAKMIMTPNSEKISDSRSMTGYGYGFSEFCSISCTLPSGAELESYSPENEPAKDSISLSASYTIESSDLDITSKCNTAKRLCETEYNYLRSIANPFASNKYVANESVQYAMYDYSYKSAYPTLTVKFNTEFGLAGDKDRSPWHIILDVISSGSKQVTCKFK